MALASASERSERNNRCWPAKETYRPGAVVELKAARK